MKITEIVETEEHIKTFFGLRNINIDQYIQTYNSLKQKLNADPTNEIIKGDIVKFYSFLDNLLRDPNWQQLENDPDYDKVYNLLLSIHSEIEKIF